MPYCLIFPGQGTQFPGMSEGLSLEWTGDDDLVGLMAKGPEDILTQTINAQKAVFSVTAALWESSGLDKPMMSMGHSLGEYMALAASGAIPLVECYKLVCARASAMHEAMPPGRGSMAAVLGMPVSEIEQVLSTIEGVWVANINLEGQVVIAGLASVLPNATDALKAKGARRVMPLKVAVASHCPLMEPARQVLARHLEDVSIGKPSVPVVFNATAREESEPAKIKGLLADQLVRPVLWAESVRYAASQGVDRFIEIGPKSVLAPMVKKIVPDAQVEVITCHGH